MMKRTAVISGIGMFAPAKVVPNSYFDELLKEDVSTWLETNVNIKERRWCSENESTADICEHAAVAALADAGITADKLNLIIVATDTPEYISPSTASVLQFRIGAVNAGTFDLNTACAGFVTALDTASKFIIADNRYQNVLVIGAYAMSKYLNMQDKKTVTLFADGAGAVVLTAEENSDRGYLTSQLHTQGMYHDWMGIYAGASKTPTTAAVVEQKDHQLKFVKKFPKELNPEMWSSMITEMANRLSVSPSGFDHYLFSQININSIRDTMELIHSDMAKAHTIMDRYGYTGSACIPMALADLKEKGLLHKGQTVCFIGSGGGLAFAGAVFKL